MKAKTYRAWLTYEIQIRTLAACVRGVRARHIYKPPQFVPSKAKRFVARSGADGATDLQVVQTSRVGVPPPPKPTLRQTKAVELVGHPARE